MEARQSVLLLVLVAACVHGQSVDLKCEADSDCETNYRCARPEPCDFGTCVCDGKYSTHATGCTLVSKIGEACTIGSQCGKGATCSTTCVCKTGYEKDNDYTCKGKAAYGEQCSDSEACEEDGTRCSVATGTCQCDGNMNRVDGSCEWEDRGATCSTDNDCISFFGLKCTSGKCACSTSNLNEKSRKFQGTKAEYCLHPDAKDNLGKGEACPSGDPGSTDESSFRFCGEGLQCGVCPYETTYKCISAASHIVCWRLMLVLPVILFIASLWG